MEEPLSFRGKIFRDFPDENFPTYVDYSKTYEIERGDEGWRGRKVLAIPNFLFSVTLKPIYHIAMAILTLAGSLYKAVVESEEVSKAYDTIDLDLFEAWGHIMTIFNDKYGRYYIESSRYQKEQSQKVGQVPKPEVPQNTPPPPAFVPPPPPAPVLSEEAKQKLAAAAAPRPINRTLKRVKSQPDLHSPERKDWEPFTISDLLAQRERILAEKRSNEKREPETSAPVKNELEDVLSRRMDALRSRVTFSPQKDPSTPEPRTPTSSSRKQLFNNKDDTPRTKYLKSKKIIPAGSAAGTSAGAQKECPSSDEESWEDR